MGFLSMLGGPSPAATSIDASSTPSHVQHVHSKDFKTFLFDLMTTTFASALMYYVSKKAMENMDPTKNSKKTEQLAKETISKLGARGRKIDLDTYEKVLLGEVIMPADIAVSFQNIGGLAQIKSQLIETVLIPLACPQMYVRSGNNGQGIRRSLVAPPRGVLFYGPPGTGKTMTAKAIAQNSGATFINLRWSTIKNKWYGESQKLVRACFSLATKLAPSIIFIDEAECFLGQRSSMGDHGETNALKAEFMSLWDGLLSDLSCTKHILVLCATNRPFDLDEAILRRMPRTFEFSLPSESERCMILKVLLVDELIDESVSFDALAQMTSSYSGSDLKEWCRFAAMVPIREVLHRVMETQPVSMNDIGRLQAASGSFEQPRPLCLNDFIAAREHVRASGSTARDYQVKHLSGTFV